MRVIEKKSNRIKEVETAFGVPIEELLRRMYVDENFTIHEIAEALNVHYTIARKWLNKAGIYSRRLW